MAFPRKLKELCTPAFIYFILSVIGILIAAVSNLRSKSNMYTLGNFSTPVPHTGLVFIVKLIYILFWTWILNLMCKDGHKNIAWFLVLLPFILMFVIIGSVMMYQKDKKVLREGIGQSDGNPRKTCPPFRTIC